MMGFITDHHQNGMRVALLLLILSLSLLPLRSAGLQQRRVGLGSRPPLCVNKCLSCRPCMATLVVSPHQRRGFAATRNEEDDAYYLLSWKCACGKKLFQP